MGAVKVSCQRCGVLQERAGLDAVPGGFGFECAECGETNVLAPVVQPAPDEPEPDARSSDETGSPPDPRPPAERRAGDPGLVTCPKCGHEQRDPDACHRCGLMFSRARARGLRFDDDPLEGHPAADSIRARWAALAEDLDDVEGHHAFIRMCAESNLLEYAGTCYRRLAERHAEDERVAGYRQRVIQAALIRVGSLEQQATDRVNTRLRGLLVLAVGALIVLGFAVGYYLLMRYQTSWQAHG